MTQAARSSADSLADLPQAAPWEILIADDDVLMRDALRMALKDMRVEGQPLVILETASAAETKRLFSEHPDIAVALLDIRMENESSGLDLIKHLRTSGNPSLQIILVTGVADEIVGRELVEAYDINGFLMKSEASAAKLFMWVYTALRACNTLRSLQGIRNDLARLMEIEGLHLLQRQRAEALLGLPRAAESLDEAEFMQFALKQAEDLTGSQIAFIHFVADDEQHVELVTWSKRTLETYCRAVFDRHYPVSAAGVWADAIRQRRPVMFNDYPGYEPKRGLPDGHAPLQRLISLPVIEQDKVVMLCGVGNKPEDYSNADIDTLQLIANDTWRLIQWTRSRKQIERFSRVIDQSRSEIFTFNPETWHFHDANEGACRNLGYSLAELRGMTPLDIQPEISAEKFRSLLLPLIDGRKAMVDFSTVHRRKNGTTYPADIQIELNRDANPVFVAVVRDVTERVEVEQSLKDALQIVAASSIVHFRVRTGGRLPVEYVSPNIARWGYEPEDFYNGKIGFIDLIYPEDLSRLDNELALAEMDTRTNALTLDYRLLTRDGRVFWVEDDTRLIRGGDGALLYYDCVISDNDAKKRYEQHLTDMLDEQVRLNRKLEEAGNQLLQSEKMASIGQLAAGVAHELNNPIGFVSSNFASLENYLADLIAIIDAYTETEATLETCCPQALERIRMLKREKDYEFLRVDTQQLVAESKDGLTRVAGIVKDLKDFSRAGDADMQWADMRKGLDSTLNVVWNELKYKCTVRKDYDDIPLIWCAPSQLNQVFLNLLVNAGHAIEKHGEITISAGRQGDEVFVAVADTGAGIPAENLTRIFDPFFTTKPIGKGTGLGLSLAYGIVRKHGGRIEVQSKLGHGAKFTVWLPINPPAEADAVPPAPTLS